MPIENNLKKRVKGINLKTQKTPNIILHESSCLHAKRTGRSLLGLGLCSPRPEGLCDCGPELCSAQQAAGAEPISPPRNTKCQLKYTCFYSGYFIASPVWCEVGHRQGNFRKLLQGRAHNRSYCQSQLHMLLVFKPFRKSSMKGAQREERK